MQLLIHAGSEFCHQATKETIFLAVDDDCEFVAETKSYSAAAFSPISIVCTEFGTA